MMTPLMILDPALELFVIKDPVLLSGHNWQDVDGDEDRY